MAVNISYQNKRGASLLAAMFICIFMFFLAAGLSIFKQNFGYALRSDITIAQLQLAEQSAKTYFASSIRKEGLSALYANQNTIIPLTDSLFFQYQIQADLFPQVQLESYFIHQSDTLKKVSTFKPIQVADTNCLLHIAENTPSIPILINFEIEGAISASDIFSLPFANASKKYDFDKCSVKPYHKTLSNLIVPNYLIQLMDSLLNRTKDFDENIDLYHSNETPDTIFANHRIRCFGSPIIQNKVLIAPLVEMSGDCKLNNTKIFTQSITINDHALISGDVFFTDSLYVKSYEAFEEVNLISLPGKISQGHYFDELQGKLNYINFAANTPDISFSSNTDIDGYIISLSPLDLQGKVKGSIWTSNFYYHSENEQLPGIKNLEITPKSERFTLPPLFKNETVYFQ